MANKLLTIPVESGFPSVDVWVNGKKYSYPTGQEVSVPEEVAAILQAKYSALPEAAGSVEKLDKVTTKSDFNRLYGIRTSGEQHVYTASYMPISYAVPLYDLSGTLSTSSPTEDTHCANKQYVDDIKPILGGTVNPDETIDAKFLGRLYMNEATGDMFYAAQNISTGSYEWRSITSKAKKQSTVPTGAGYVGQLCLVGSSDFSPYDVYICVMSNPASNIYMWHKMCTTEAPQ